MDCSPSIAAVVTQRPLFSVAQSRFYADALLRGLRNHVDSSLSVGSIMEKWARGASRTSTLNALDLLAEEGSIERVMDGDRWKYRAFTVAEIADRASAKGLPKDLPEGSPQEFAAAVSGAFPKAVSAGDAEPESSAPTAPEAPAPPMPRHAKHVAHCATIVAALRERGSMTNMQLSIHTGLSTGLVSNMTAMLAYQGVMTRPTGKGVWTLTDKASTTDETVIQVGNAPTDIQSELAGVLDSLSRPAIVIAPIDDLDDKIMIVSSLALKIGGKVGEKLAGIAADLKRIAEATAC